MRKMPSNTILLQQLMDNMTDNIFFKDREHRFIMINQANARWFGYDRPEEAVGKTDFELFDDEFARRALEDEEQVMKSGTPMQGAEEQTLHNGEAVWGHVTKVPLRDEDGTVIGLIGIGRDITELKRKEAELAEANSKLRATNRQIADDLAMAAQLQQTFLPQSYPEFTSPDGHRLLDFHHYYKADVELGGDFCAVYRLSDTKAGLLICDVMGHGVLAALVTGIIRTIAQELLHTDQSAGEYMTALNEKLYPLLRANDEYIFATACFLIINAETGELTGSLAGHIPPLLLHPETGQARPLSAEQTCAGPALAVEPDYAYQDFSHSLRSGDKVLMCTDGILEAQNSSGTEFGEQRFLQALQDNCRKPLKDLIDQVLDDAEKFMNNQQFGDDICLLGFSFTDRNQGA